MPKNIIFNESEISEIATMPENNADKKHVTKTREKMPPFEFSTQSLRPMCLFPYHLNTPPIKLNAGTNPFSESLY